MKLYALKNKYTNRLAVLEVCGECVYLVDADEYDEGCLVFIYTESDIKKMQDALDNVHQDIYTQIDPDQYEVVKFK
ncbi:hypothetical protein ASwh1_378 [Aeromonas phage Aswh_1]|nr:hypothetical protein ASwh1_378 [Aeromonas phage Aswh_1]